MKKTLILLIFLLFALLACVGEPSPADTPLLDATVLYETVVSQATADYVKTQREIDNQTPAAVSTQTPDRSPTPIPTIDRTRPPLYTPTPEIPCNKAAAGQPIDVTIPDGMVMAPGESFTKTWRLKNAGTCTWTRLYALTFFSGNSLNAAQINNLSQPVAPGQEIDISIDMEAPQTEGGYQSNWMLGNTEGELFGIGPNGDAPFWVRIEVVNLGTDTPQPAPTVTSTPVVYVAGNEAMGSGDQLDLDSATLNPSDTNMSDFSYQYGGSPAHVLTALNGMQWMVYGEETPSFSECTDASMTDVGISFDDVPAGTYLCYRTSDSLPGRLLIEGFETNKLLISFLTWSIP